MNKYIIIKELVDNKINNKQASIKLRMSVRTIIRLKQKYLAKGKSAFEHGNKDKIPVNKTKENLETKIKNLYKEKFFAWTLNHFADYILNHKLVDSNISTSTIKRIIGRNNIKNSNLYKTKSKPTHPLRERKENIGELIQMDASKHDWLSNNEYLHLHLGK